jgi:hypothetical protein
VRARLPVHTLILIAILARPALADPVAPRQPVFGLGYEYDLGGAREEFLLPDPIDDPSVVSDHPLHVRIRVPWALVEPTAGAYDWSEVDRILAPYRAARHAVSLCLFGANPEVGGGARPGPDQPGVLKAWLEISRAMAGHFRGQVASYEVDEGPNLVPGWRQGAIAHYAYLLKQTSVAIRSADPAARIVQGTLTPEAGEEAQAIDWQRRLFGAGIATYVDAFPVRPPAGGAVEASVTPLAALVLEQDPSAQIWVHAVAPRGEDDRRRAADLIRQFAVAQGEGAALVTFDLEADVEGQPEFRGVILDLHRLFLPTFGRVEGSFRFESPAAGGPGHATAYGFFDSGSFQGLVAYVADRPEAIGSANLILNTAAVQGVVVYDIVGGAAGPVRAAQPDFKANVTRIPVAVFDRPLVLQYARVAIKGFEADKEALQVPGTGLVTAEEVIAAHQVFMADQNARLRHYQADALLNYRFKVAGSNSVDIGIENAFFWDPERSAEWQQQALFYNGVRWKGKRLPELPIPQPEKVFSLPLEINLDRSYVYEYLGREKAEGYDCHVLEFRPNDSSGRLYKGKAWIESRTGALVKTSTVQGGLAPPLISNEEVDVFGPVAGPDGTTYWLRTRIDGQQVFTIAGQNVVLLRDIAFSRFRINADTFEVDRQAAYASGQTMLRDTDQGLRYLDPTPEGGREVRQSTRQSALLAFGGLFRQSGLEYPVLPLAGAAYFDFNVNDRPTQTTMLLGGVVNLFNLSDPDFLGTRLDGSVQGLLFLVDVTDQPYILGNEVESSRADIRSQYLTLGLGVPIGNFFRIKGTYELSYANASRDDATDTFEVPADTFIHAPGLSFEFNRDRWSVTAAGRYARRGDWTPWGDTTPLSDPSTDPEIAAAFPSSPCATPGSCLAEFDPDQRSYLSYDVSVSRQFFLRRFQRLRAEAQWFGGDRLDRFSQHQFSFFGSRVRGLSGSGVRFETGGLARFQYGFNIANIVRFEASVDYARVRDPLLPDQWQSFTGVGVLGNLMGPWETIVIFDLGVAIQSDIGPLRGDTEFQIGLLKYF